jgi:GH24 family phage-related lysozyme (muramidase)
MISLHTLQRTKRLEGSIPHMYLDTRGNVTVGVGQLLANADAAAVLAFVRKSDGKTATTEEKRADWTTIRGQKKGKLAKHYDQFANLALPDTEIDALLRKSLQGCEGALKGIFADYDTFPAAVQEALLDMVFNLGSGGFRKFSKLIDAAKKKKWRVCATECHRRGISEARNTETRRLFESAAP